MASIDERIVSMAFDNAKFEQGVAQTMRTLAKFDTSLQQIGAKNSIQDIEKSANKVTLQQPMSALDKLKSRLFGAGDGAAQGFSDIERSANKVQLDQPIRAVGKVQDEISQISRGAPKAFNEIERAANQTTLDGLSSSLTSVTAQFSVMQGAAAVALGNLATKATAVIGQLAQKLTGIQTIQDGFSDYQLKIGATQTIMAGTGEGIGAVTKYLKDLDIYADRTIYSLKDMTSNIGKFTNAGVKLPIAVDAMKGISNVAALSGANAGEAARAMYNLGQAIGQGTVRLMDWRSVELANMGTKEFKEELIKSGLAMGTLKKGSDGVVRSLKGSEVNYKTFTMTLQDQWLTSEALTKTLRKYSDENTNLGKRAYAAATNVKTFSMMMETLAAAAGTGWTDTFELILGNLPEATKLFTGITTAVGGFLGKTADARNALLQGWKDLGGRKVLLESLKDVFQALFAILKPIGQAFRDIFPRKTSEELFEMTKNFAAFTARLKPGADVVEGLRRTFRGLFAVLHIGWEVAKGVIGVIGDLVGVLGSGSGGFLNFTGSIGDFLVAVDAALTKGGLLTSFFDNVSDILKIPLQLLMGVSKAVFSLFGGVDESGADALSGGLDKVTSAAGPLEQALTTLKGAWDKLVHIFKDAKDLVSPWMEKIGEQLSNLGSLLANAFETADFDKVMAFLQTGFIGGIFLSIKKGIGNFGGVKDLFGGLNETFGALTGNLEAMQKRVQAETIKAIAIAIGILAASIWVLSKIDAGDLSKSMSAIAVGFGQLVAAMAILGSVMKGQGKLGLISMPVIAASMIGLATSMVILSGAMKIFSTMSWGELAKGLVGVGGALAAIGVGMKALGPGTIIQGPAILVLAIGINALALAVKQFSSLSWEDLARGLVGVVGALVALISPVSILGPSLLITGPGLIAAAFGMNMLAGALARFSEIDAGKMAVGIGGMIAALATIGIAIGFMPPLLIAQAAALILLGVALTSIAGSLKVMGSIGIENLIVGLTGMAGALAILAIGLTAMSLAGPGAVALLGAAAAFAVLGPALAFMGQLNVLTIVKGLVAMAAVLGVLALAGMYAAPGLTALGIALLPLAGVFALAAVATLTFAKALQMLGGEGKAGIGVMIAALTAFVALIPKLLVDFVKGLVDVVAEVAKLAPKVVGALIKILDQIIEVVIRSAPRLALAIGVLITQFATVVGQNAPKIIAAGWKLLLDLLRGIDNNIGQVIPLAASIIGKFLSGLAAQAPKLIASGARLIVTFLSGVASKISAVVQAAYSIAFAFLDGVIRSVPKFVEAGVRAITGFLGAVARSIPKLISAGVRIITSFLNGVSSQFGKVAQTATNFVVRFFNAIGNRENIRRMVDSGLKAAINVLRGMADGLRNDENISQVIRAAADIGLALVEGIAKGLGGLPKIMANKLTKPIGDGVGFVKDKLGIKSPSTVFKAIGVNMVEGLAIGLTGVPGALRRSVSAPIERMLRENQNMRAMGAYLGKEFAEGLTGGLWGNGKSQAQSQIEGAFAGLRDQLKANQDELAGQVKEGEDKIQQLLGEKNSKGRNHRIMSTMAEVARDKKLLQESKTATNLFMASLQDEQNALVQLSYEYTNVSESLDKAKQALDEATRARDDAIKSYTEQYSQLPNIGTLMDQALNEAMMTAEEKADAARKKREEVEKRRKINQVEEYKKALREQIAATTKYMVTLSKLRDAGLDDTTYKQLLSMGTAGQEFAGQLLSQGPKGIDELNKLNSDLAKAASEIAKNAGSELYQAGVDAAQGLVNGLQNRQNEIRQVMEKIANSMIEAIKNQLGIRSPSRVFAQLGKFAAQGMADGLKAGSQVVTDAAAGMGDNAAAALTNSLANLSDRVGSEIDTDLTITPVLDLTQVQKDASKIQDLANVTPITAAASFGQASAIAQEHADVSAAIAEDSAQKVIDFKFEQNNTSPKALDDVEIYRQTRNQLSQVTKALGLVS